MWVVIGDALIALNRHSRNTINYNLILYRVLSEPEPKAVNKISSSPSRLFDGSMIINFISFDSRWDLHFTSRGLYKCCFSIFNDFLLASWAPICNIRIYEAYFDVKWRQDSLRFSTYIDLTRDNGQRRWFPSDQSYFSRLCSHKMWSVTQMPAGFFFCYKIKNVSPGSTLERAYIGE